MSLLSRLQAHGAENVQNKVSSIKQSGSTQIKPQQKRKALAFVQNTLTNGQSTSHTPGKLLKPVIAKAVVSGQENKKSDKTAVKQKDNTFLSLSNKIEELSVEEDDFLVGCECYEKIEDDFDDSYFKEIRFTKQQIDNLAMGWIKPPVLSAKDKREINCGEDIQLNGDTLPHINLSLKVDANLIEEVDLMDVPMLELEEDIPETLADR